MIHRRIIGALLGAGMVAFLAGSLALARTIDHDASGEAVAERDLAYLVERVELTHARDGRLCGSSLLSTAKPMQYPWRGAEEEEETKANVGFHCLGVERERLQSGNNAFVYEQTRDHFVLRTFCASGIDTKGVLPAFERRGMVRNGKLVVDPELRRVARR